MIDITLLNQLVLLWGLYYVFLFGLLAVRRAKGPARRRRIRTVASTKPVVMVIPAHNEQDVLEHTITALLAIDHTRLLILVMNDGSSDRTSEIAREFLGSGKVVVVDRAKEIAGKGKGAVLNDAYGRINAMIADADSPLAGCDPHEVIVGIMDADGQLERQALNHVIPLFDAPSVGAVQIGVRIANARVSLLTRLQDVEFVGFSAFVQEARDVIGSVGLGGNGQFTRLSALQSLGRDPWTDCLTEDLDLGLSLVEEGWRVRFSADAYVAQQGVLHMGPLLRQRTRWIQGHYQCWAHIPSLLDSERVSNRTRIDLILYLVLVTFVLLISAGVILSVMAQTGYITTTSRFLEGVTAGPARNALQLTLSLGPLLIFAFAYQVRATQRFHWWELPTFMLVFSLYTYVFAVSQIWALSRIVLRRGSWAKTPRSKAEVGV